MVLSPSRVLEFFWTTGTLIVPTLAYLVLKTPSSDNGDDGSGESHWQIFVMLCTFPCFIGAVCGVVFVPESPRWLLEQSPVRCPDGPERALNTLKRVARINGIDQATIDEELFPPNTRLIISWDEVAAAAGKNQHEATIVQDLPRNSIQSHSSSNHWSFGQLFNTPERRRMTILLWAVWFGFGFTYFGTIVAVALVFTYEHDDNNNADANGNANDDLVNASDSSYDFDFAAIFITASAELLGLIVVMYTVEAFGRIPSMTVSYRAGGIVTFALGILCVVWVDHGDNQTNDDSERFHRSCLIALAFLARMFTMASSCVTWVSTSEILPTDIRSTGHGASNAFSRMGGAVAPYIITEGNSMALIGTVVLLISLVTAECANQLPETAGKFLGDTSGELLTAAPGLAEKNDEAEEEDTSYRQLS